MFGLFYSASEMTFFRDFFWGLESGAPKLPKMCVFDLKNEFFAEQDRHNSQNHFRKISSILETVQDCENAYTPNASTESV